MLRNWYYNGRKQLIRRVGYIRSFNLVLSVCAVNVLLEVRNDLLALELLRGGRESLFDAY